MTKKLKLYVKPFKKYFNVIEIDLRYALVIFDQNQIEEALVNKKKSDFWNVDNWDKWEKLTKPYMTSMQNTAGIAFKKKFIRFPKTLKSLKDCL